MKKIIYTQEDGSVAVLTKGINETRTLEELAEKDVPKGCSWRIIEEEQLPFSRQWRNAWTDEFETETVDVDFEKAKDCHKLLIAQLAEYRVPVDVFGQKDYSTVSKELEDIDFDSITTLDELYNTWPASIETRLENRKYESHKQKNAE